ncbi:unnamed protein product [Prunus armeniaca]|uniref:Uncharacterized protein n=1 Tax=Prunus armeniaca TaxID=36596 RepID=A0A6J5TUB5_PRUAR|nr:unnamed protein product [Prunus armeniaca]
MSFVARGCWCSPLGEVHDLPIRVGLVPVPIISWRVGFILGLCPWMLFWVMSWGGTIADNFNVS